MYTIGLLALVNHAVSQHGTTLLAKLAARAPLIALSAV